MSSILSQEEITALLTALKEGEALPKPDPVEPRDFRRPLMCSLAAMETLRGVMSGVGQSLASKITDTLGYEVKIELTGLDQERFENILNSLPAPCCGFGFQMDPLPEQAFVSLDTPVALAAVDKLLGGSGKQQFEVREIFPTEKPMIESLVGGVLQGLVEGLQDSLEFKPATGDFIGKPGEIKFLSPEAGVLAARFGVSGDIPPGEILVVIPFKNLGPLLGSDASGGEGGEGSPAGGPTGDVKPAIAGALNNVGVEASCTLGRGRILLGDLLMLEPGDVATLATQVDDPVELSISGVSTFLGRYGQKEGKIAVKIESVNQGGRIGGK